MSAPEGGLEVREGGEGGIPGGERGRFHGPLEAEAVPAQAPVVARLVHRAHLVEQGGAFLQRQETVGKALGQVEAVGPLGAQLHRRAAPVGG